LSIDGGECLHVSDTVIPRKQLLCLPVAGWMCPEARLECFGEEKTVAPVWSQTMISLLVNP